MPHSSKRSRDYCKAVGLDVKRSLVVLQTMGQAQMQTQTVEVGAKKGFIVNV